jgi:hypothetical protein
MGSAAHELDDLREAADRAVSLALTDLLAAVPDSPPVSSSASDSVSDSVSGASSSASPGPVSQSVQLFVVGPGRLGELNAAGPVSFDSFGRGVVIPALIEGSQVDPGLPTPIMVARYLASRDLEANPGHRDVWASARWITTCGDEASALGAQLASDGTRVALILVADGAACHGPKAPRAQDARAQPYDDSVCAALASGQPGRLALIDAGLGGELGASGPQVWPVLVAAAGGEMVGDVLWSGAPYGVGWAVASWRRHLQRIT